MFRRLLFIVALFFASGAAAAPAWVDVATSIPTAELSPQIAAPRRVSCTWTAVDGHGSTLCGALLVDRAPHLNFKFDPDTTGTAGSSRVHVYFCPTSTYSANSCSKILINRGGVGLDTNPMDGSDAGGTYMWDIPTVQSWLVVVSTADPVGGESSTFTVEANNQ